jgi:hypothetical protein
MSQSPGHCCRLTKAREPVPVPAPDSTRPIGASRAYRTLVLIASAVLMVTMDARQSQGLFISPLNTSTGMDIVSISLAIAVGHFV